MQVRGECVRPGRVLSGPVSRKAAIVEGRGQESLMGRELAGLFSPLPVPPVGPQIWGMVMVPLPRGSWHCRDCTGEGTLNSPGLFYWVGEEGCHCLSSHTLPSVRRVALGCPQTVLDLVMGDLAVHSGGFVRYT